MTACYNHSSCITQERCSLEFPKFLVNSIVSERKLAESSGVPIEVSRKGKAPPLERGRGKYPHLRIR